MLRPTALLLLLASGAVAQHAKLELREFSIELTAEWEPLTDTVYKFEKKYPLVRDLRPAVEVASYEADRFRKFLPQAAVAVGDTWKIDGRDALPFLRQLHPGATQELHHDGGFGLGAHGGWACLRALDRRYAEVRLRVHADFLIAGDGERRNSSWFTPAQFAGRMLIDRQRGKVVAFELGVPDQNANVDVNIASEAGVFADIGRVPRMSVAGGKTPTDAFGADDAEQIAESEAEQVLVRKFYPFAHIEWLDLAAARVESRKTGKPLHVIALFGSLLDESC